MTLKKKIYICRILQSQDSLFSASKIKLQKKTKNQLNSFEYKNMLINIVFLVWNWNKCVDINQL